MIKIEKPSGSTGASTHREERLHLLPFLPLSDFHSHGYWRKGMRDFANLSWMKLGKKNKFRRMSWSLSKTKDWLGCDIAPPRIQSSPPGVVSPATMESWEGPDFTSQIDWSTKLLANFLVLLNRNILKTTLSFITFCWFLSIKKSIGPLFWDSSRPNSPERSDEKSHRSGAIVSNIRCQYLRWAMVAELMALVNYTTNPQEITYPEIPRNPPEIRVCFYLTAY